MWHVFHLMAGLLRAAERAVVVLGGRIDRLAADNVESTVKDRRQRRCRSDDDLRGTPGRGADTTYELRRALTAKRDGRTS